MNPQITLTQDITDPSVFFTIGLDEAIHSIRSEKFKDFVEPYRYYLEKNGWEKDEHSKALKRNLPAFSFSGTFTDRVLNENLNQFSGIYSVDIDGLAGDELNKIRDLVCSLPFVLFAFNSPSMNGLKVGLRVDPEKIKNDDDFKKYFPFVEKFFLDTLKVKIDKSNKDIRRFCFVSCDSDIYYNADAEIFDLQVIEEPVQHPEPPKTGQLVSFDGDIVNECIRRIIACFNDTIQGERHETRLRAGNLAGGYIAGGLIDYETAYAVLVNMSDQISDRGVTPKSELKTIRDGIEEGMKTPILELKITAKQKQDSLITEDFDPETEAQDWHDEAIDVDFTIPFDCLAKDIQEWILDTSPYQQPGIAFCAALSFISCLIGRGMNFNSIKGNFMSICISPSGSGKDRPLKAIQSLLAHPKINLTNSIIGDIASGSGLFAAVRDAKNHSAVCLIDEFGHFIGSVSNKGSNQHSREILPLITKMYTDASGMTPGKSKAGGGSEVIFEPNLSILGMTTEEQLMNVLNSTFISDGSMPRYLFIFGIENQLRNKKFNPNTYPPDDLIEKILAFKTKYCHEFILSSPKAKASVEYHERFDELWDLSEEIVRDTEKYCKDEFTPVYKRTHVRAQQMSMLIDPSMNIDVLNWCFNLNKKCTGVFVNRFKSKVFVNEYHQYSQEIEHIIKKAGKKGASGSEICRAKRHITKNMRESILTDLVENDLVVATKEKKTTRKQKKPRTLYFWKG